MSTSTESPLVQLSDAMADAVAKAGASTVLVNARRRMPASGIAFSSNLVLTADHVVERDEEIQILLPDGSQVEASLAGRDPGSDLALLSLSSSPLLPAEIAAQEGRVGQLALAVGRPSPEGIEASLGVISATGGPIRTPRGSLVERYIRTDTIPYPGFSGGPLVDAAGRVLGLNTSGLAPGVSLTLPAGLVWQVAQALKEHGQVRRGYLGIRSQAVVIPAAQRAVIQAALEREQETGLLLVGIEEDSPASQGGLMVGDILAGMAGQALLDPDELLSHLSGALVGKAVEMEVLRGGQIARISVTIGERK